MGEHLLVCLWKSKDDEQPIDWNVKEWAEDPPIPVFPETNGDVEKAPWPFARGYVVAIMLIHSLRLVVIYRLSNGLTWCSALNESCVELGMWETFAVTTVNSGLKCAPPSFCRNFMKYWLTVKTFHWHTQQCICNETKYLCQLLDSNNY